MLYRLLILLLFSTANIQAQSFPLRARAGSALPATCSPASISTSLYYKTSGTRGLYVCTAADTWTLTATPAGSIVVVAGKTFTVSNTMTLTATDGSTVAFGAGGTVAYTGSGLNQFAATTSAQLAGVLSNETGSDALVFANTPTLTTPYIAWINGGSAANDDVTIQGTTDAMRASSYVNIQPNGGNVGIGTVAPLAALHSYRGTAAQALFSGYSSVDGVGSANSGEVLIGENTAFQGQVSYRNANGQFYFRNTYDNATAGFQFQTRTSGTIVNALTILGTGNVGVGTTSVTSGQALEVNGGLNLTTAAARPACNATTRGTFWVVQSGAGVADTVAVCAKDAADAYAWRTIY